MTPGSTLTLTNGGVIKSGSGLGSLGSSGSFLTSGAEYVFNSATVSDELAVNATITNGAGLTKTGAGVLTLSNSGNSYGGATVIAARNAQAGQLQTLSQIALTLLSDPERR